jgi:hypothetical protein
VKLTPIIEEIKAKCPTFEQRAAGAAEYANLRNRSNLTMPAAYVVPMDENASELGNGSGYRQMLTEGFSVIVVISNQADERGQQAANQLHDLRAELWAALLGFEIDDYDQITYSGGNLLHVDRSRLDYQFDFNAVFYIDIEDTRRGADLATLPAFESVTVELDHKDLPPDGNVDHTLDVSVPQ